MKEEQNHRTPPPRFAGGGFCGSVFFAVFRFAPPRLFGWAAGCVGPAAFGLAAGWGCVVVGWRVGLVCVGGGVVAAALALASVVACGLGVGWVAAAFPAVVAVFRLGG